MTMRIKFNIPSEHQVFKCQIAVRIDDINYGNHLSNDRLLTYAHECRLQYFRALGYQDERDVGGQSLIMSDSAIMYRGEGFYGDILKVSLFSPPPHEYGFDLFYLMSNQESKEVARIKTGLVFYDYQNKKLIKNPSGFEGVLKSVQ